MKIAIASDHGGFELKEKIFNYLIKKGYSIENFGTDSIESCDYPVFAKKVCNAILNDGFEKGILICGTGIGMSMMANRFKGIRAACLSDKYSAQMTRKHNDSNVLCFGARVIDESLAQEIVDVWLETQYEGGRHQKRIDMLDV
ncbi:MAG: ribose 5-phosphate isomerase B [Candidatus Gastranaerophilales bacterium]|nr:ribose 5-phosphate isomerase B [Candidatus Gastranaerophilales bacterium]